METNAAPPAQPPLTIVPRLSVRERHGSHCVPVAGTDCLRWAGAMRKGYPVFRVAPARDGLLDARRAAYELCHGPLLDSQTIEPTCAHKWCCNGQHYRVTPKPRRRPKKVTRLSVETKLVISEAVVAGIPVDEVAKAFRVTPRQVRYAVCDIHRRLQRGLPIPGYSPPTTRALREPPHTTNGATPHE